MPFVARDSTLVTVFAGGNDANTIGTAVAGGAAGTDVNGYVAQQARSFGTDYGRLIAGIRSRAPSARVIVRNLPNLALLPYVEGRSTTERRTLQQIAVSLSAQGNAMAGQGAVVVDLMCNSRSYDAGSYSGDGFHPNDAEYAFLASELQAAVDGGVSPPSSDCTFMRGI